MVMKYIQTFESVNESDNWKTVKNKSGDTLKPGKKYKMPRYDGEITFIRFDRDNKTLHLKSNKIGKIRTSIDNVKDMELIESVNEKYEDYGWRLEINPTRGGISPDALRKKLTDAGIDFKEERKNRWQILAPKDGSGSSEAKRLLDMNHFNNYKIYESVNEDYMKDLKKLDKGDIVIDEYGDEWTIQKIRWWLGSPEMTLRNNNDKSTTEFPEDFDDPNFFAWFELKESVNEAKFTIHDKNLELDFYGKSKFFKNNLAPWTKGFRPGRDDKNGVITIPQQNLDKFIDFATKNHYDKNYVLGKDIVIMESLHEAKEVEVTQEMWDKEWKIRKTFGKEYEEHFAKRTEAAMSKAKNEEMAENWAFINWKQLPGKADGMTIKESVNEAKEYGWDDLLDVLMTIGGTGKILNRINMKDPEVEELLDSTYKSYPDFAKAVKSMYNLKESVNEATFNYMKDSDEVRDLFKKITGKSGHDVLDSTTFQEKGRDGWMLNTDDTPISDALRSKFVDAVMKLGKKKGWEIKQYGDDAIEIFESVNESTHKYIKTFEVATQVPAKMVGMDILGDDEDDEDDKKKMPGPMGMVGGIGYESEGIEEKGISSAIIGVLPKSIFALKVRIKQAKKIKRQAVAAKDAKGVADAQAKISALGKKEAEQQQKLKLAKQKEKVSGIKGFE